MGDFERVCWTGQKWTGGLSSQPGVEFGNQAGIESREKLVQTNHPPPAPHNQQPSPR